MIQPAMLEDPVIVLPSDQEASGRSFGPEEVAQLMKVLESGTLTCTKGTACATLEKRFAELLGAKYAIACASGSAAVHCAIAAIDPEPGDEIITTPITDMGALTPILYQGAIPVFADVDPFTGNLTADSIAERLSDRTKAIIVTHLFGNPCAMGPVFDLAAKHDLPVVEDCAQAYLARVGGKLVGTHGAIGCFSLQQGKHITTGEGGLIVTNDPHLARRIRLFVNKAWGYGDANPDHYFLALNYRLTELQGAVALAQLDKLVRGVEQRRKMAARLTAQLQDLAGITTPGSAPDAVHVFWRYCLWVDEDEVPGGSPPSERVCSGRGSRRRRDIFKSRRFSAKSSATSGPSAAAVFPLLWPRRKRSITRRIAFPACSSACEISWCYPGTSALPRSTSTSSPPRW